LTTTALESNKCGGHFLRISDVFHNEGFDNTNFGCIGTAVAAGKLLGLSRMGKKCVDSSSRHFGHHQLVAIPGSARRNGQQIAVCLREGLHIGHTGRGGIFGTAQACPKGHVDKLILSRRAYFGATALLSDLQAALR
jgi:hypothetical protein